MRPRAVVVAHRQAMVAEGLAAALALVPGFIVRGVVTSSDEAERQGARVDAVALDAELVGSHVAARSLRGRGVRVVLIADRQADGEGVAVPLTAPVSVLAAALVPGLRDRPSASSSLSTREREVLGLIARGLPAKQVGRQLGISAKTVEQHKARIFRKLEVPNQAAAVRAALTGGLV